MKSSLAFIADAGVEGYFPYPGVERSITPESSGAFPQVDEDFLKEVCHLVIVFFLCIRRKRNQKTTAFMKFFHTLIPNPAKFPENA